MGIDLVVTPFFILLLAGAVISFVVGLGFMKKLQSFGKGYFALFSLSLMVLIVLLLWFQSASGNLTIGTIPWVIDQAVAILVYPFYLIICWFLLKKMSKKSSLT